MNIKELIKEYLDNNTLMQLATVHDGKPWICTVYFVADEFFNLYWMSTRERQHSVEITKDSRVAITIVRDTERKQAIQTVGNAREVAYDELEQVHELYQNKFGKKD
ncbi:MAG: pyridoxamine 5'-phosphate oxidase family protein [bacterium]|nr:pyridoxamine 5'-phosphate oxidase family protein [bacterium]